MIPLSIPRCPARLVCLFLGMAFWGLAPRQCPGQVAGKNDPTFGASLGLAGQTNAAIVQPDGKILVGGSFGRGLCRVNPDGSQDAKFQVNLEAVGGGATERVHVVGLLADGKIMVTSVSENLGTNPIVIRLNADGSSDPAYQTRALANLISSVNLNSCLLQIDGKMVLASRDPQSFNPVVYRLNPDGTLDGTFNAGNDADGFIDKTALQPDGKILLAGSFSHFQGVTRAGVVRLNTNGTVDSAFDVGSGAYSSTGATIRAVTVRPDGKMYLGGYFQKFNGANYSQLVRLNVNGSVDTTFTSTSGTGSLFIPYVYTVTIRPNGKVLVGLSSAAQYRNAAGTLVLRDNIVQLNEDGSFDEVFGTAPVRQSNYNRDYILSVAVEADGRLLVVKNLSLLRLTANGASDPSLRVDVAPGPNAAVGYMLCQTDGKIVISGEFTQFNGQDRARLARINADGTLDTSFNPAATINGPIDYIAIQPDQKILISGLFDSVGGSTHYYVARLLPSGQVDSTFNTVQSGSLYSAPMLVLPSGQVLVYGENIIRLNANGSVDTTFNQDSYFSLQGGPTGGNTRLRLLADGKLMVAGYFDAFNGVTRNGIARLTSTGYLDTSFNPGAGGEGSKSLALQADGRPIVTGLFDGTSTSFSFVARFNTNGTRDTTFSTAADHDAYGDINTIELTGGKALLGGTFYLNSGSPQAPVQKSLVRLLDNGSFDPSFEPGTAGGNGNGALYMPGLTVQPDGRILAGGAFNTFNGQIRNYLVRLNANGSVDKTFNPGVGTPQIMTLALQPADGKVVIGGAFTSAGGQLVNALARLRSDGSPDPAFLPPFSPGDSVLALQRQTSNGAIIASALVADTATPRPASLANIGPSLDNDPTRIPPGPTVDGKIKNPIVRVSSLNGSIDTTFSTSAATNGAAATLSLQADGKIIVGGTFTQLNAVSRQNLGRLNANGTLDTAFTASTDQPVAASYVQADGKILIGGSFARVNGVLGVAGFTRLTDAGVLDPTFNRGTGTTSVNTIKVQTDGKILLGGSFSSVNGSSRICVARLTTAGLVDSAFVPAAIARTGGGATVNSIEPQADGKVIIAGLFDSVGGAVRRQTARLNADGSLDTAYNDSGTDAVVRATALQPDGKTLLGGDFTTVGDATRTGAARLLGDYTALEQWRVTNFGTPTGINNAADLAAPFGDGVSNLLKYALNLNAQAADTTQMTATGSKGLPLPGRTVEGKLNLTFVRRKASTAPGIAYSVEFSNGLGAATPFAVNSQATTSTPVSIDATWERVTVTDSIASGQPTRFVRLRVSSP